MARWEYVLTCLETDPMQLDRELDWVIKKKLIETYVESRQLKWNSAKVMMLDLQYHNIRPELGLYYKLEKDGRVERIVSDDEVEHAMHHPPETTRAKFRWSFCESWRMSERFCVVLIGAISSCTNPTKNSSFPRIPCKPNMKKPAG